MAVTFDPDKGLAATGWNRDVDYRGFTVHMKPKQFLDLNPPRGQEHMTALDHIRSHIAKGGAIAPPFLSVRWHPEEKQWHVYGHEGRGRSHVLHELQPDTEIPVHIMPTGPDYELRARHLTDEHLFAPIAPDPRRIKHGARMGAPFRPVRVQHMGQEKQSPAAAVAEALLTEAAPFVGDIEAETARNTDYRRVLFTTPRSQLVLMSLKPKESIGLEQHANDQFFRIEKGRAKFLINGQTSTVGPGDAVVVPANSKHNVTNASSSEPLRMYTIYSPAKHPSGTIEHTKADAERKVKLGLHEQLDGLAAARAATHQTPTEAQKHAGNYPKGKVQLHGLTITIENPKGSTRSGTDRTGKTWKSLMRHDYGYINGTVGRDKDHLDAFLGPHHESELVHVVDQVSPHSGRFDEAKVLFGFRNRSEAKEGYESNYAKGWKGLGALHSTTVEDFKDWIARGDTLKPFAVWAKLRRAVPNTLHPTTEVFHPLFRAPAITESDASAIERLPHRALRDPEMVRDLVHRPPLTVETDTLIDGPLVRAHVHAAVSGLIDNQLQVGRVIVESVPVFVMHDLATKKRAAEHLLHHDPVFESLRPAIGTDEPVESLVSLRESTNVPTCVWSACRSASWLSTHGTSLPQVQEAIEAVVEGARPDRALAGVTHTVPHAGGQLQFTLPYALRHSRSHLPVMLDVAKVEQGWRKDRGFHIGPGGTGDAIRGRYERFGEFLKSGTPIEMPEIGTTQGGRVVFTNGRHRFAVLRDQGVHELPFMVSREEAPAIVQQFGARSQLHEGLGLVKIAQRPYLLDPRDSEMEAEVYDFGRKRKSERYFPRHGVEHEFAVIHPQHGDIGTLHVVHTERSSRRLYVPWMQIHTDHQREVTPLSLRDSIMAHFPKARELRGQRITGRRPGLRSYTLPPERTNKRQGELFHDVD